MFCFDTFSGACRNSVTREGEGEEGGWGQNRGVEFPCRVHGQSFEKLRKPVCKRLLIIMLMLTFLFDACRMLERILFA